jgi:vancomycin resistance protein YoaR
LDQDNNKPNKKLAIIVIGIIMFSVLLLSFFFYYINSQKDIVGKNTLVYIKGELLCNISNLTYTQAIAKANEDIANYTSQDIYININDDTKTYAKRPIDIGINMKLQDLESEVKNSLYGTNALRSLLMHIKNNNKIDLSMEVVIDENVFNKFIESIQSEYEKPPKDAEIFVNKKGQVDIKDESVGCTIDLKEARDVILSSVKVLNKNISLPKQEVVPAIIREVLNDDIPKKEIASYSTYYGGSDSGRKENIRLGASLINNILLKPEEEFEFFKYVGEPTAKNGFKPAGIFLNGRVATGIGGGLCQVSTTLYNAALLADLEITKRSPHGLPVYYVPLGLDATVAYGGYTLKFKNNTGKYILIKSNTDKDNLTFSIYGYMPEGKTVNVYAKNVGYNTAEAYRVIYMDGKEVRTDFLGRSKYKTPK